MCYDSVQDLTDFTSRSLPIPAQLYYIPRDLPRKRGSCQKQRASLTLRLSHHPRVKVHALSATTQEQKKKSKALSATHSPCYPKQPDPTSSFPIQPSRCARSGMARGILPKHPPAGRVQCQSRVSASAAPFSPSQPPPQNSISSVLVVRISPVLTTDNYVYCYCCCYFKV